MDDLMIRFRKIRRMNDRLRNVKVKVPFYLHKIEDNFDEIKFIFGFEYEGTRRWMEIRRRDIDGGHELSDMDLGEKVWEHGYKVAMDWIKDDIKWFLREKYGLV